MHIINYLPEIIIFTFIFGAIFFWPVMEFINKHAGPVLRAKARLITARRVEDKITIDSTLPDLGSPDSFMSFIRPPIEIEQISYTIEFENLKDKTRFEISVPEEVYYELPDEAEIIWRKEWLTGKDFGHRIAA